MEALIDLGVTRILTSGGLQSAYDGAETIAQLVELAAGRIEILPGGGIGAAHVADLLRRTGCRQLHIGASCRVVDPSLQGNAQVGLCDLAKLEGGGYRAVDADRVVEAAAKLREAE